MVAKIENIRTDPNLSPLEKQGKLSLLSPSGCSDEEFRVLRAAQKEAP